MLAFLQKECKQRKVRDDMVGSRCVPLLARNEDMYHCWTGMRTCTTGGQGSRVHVHVGQGSRVHVHVGQGRCNMSSSGRGRCNMSSSGRESTSAGSGRESTSTGSGRKGKLHVSCSSGRKGKLHVSCSSGREYSMRFWQGVLHEVLAGMVHVRAWHGQACTVMAWTGMYGHGMDRHVRISQHRQACTDIPA